MRKLIFPQYWGKFDFYTILGEIWFLFNISTHFLSIGLKYCLRLPLRIVPRYELHKKLPLELSLKNPTIFSVKMSRGKKFTRRNRGKKQQLFIESFRHIKYKDPGKRKKVTGALEVAICQTITQLKIRLLYTQKEKYWTTYYISLM